MAGRKPIVGLVGGIASGKSQVAYLLGELGAGVISADQLNHEVLQCDDVREQIRAWWGDDLFDANGTLRRDLLADIVFQDPVQRRRLESLTHPLINRRRQEMIERFRQDDAVAMIVLDVPLLVEVGQDQMCDRLIFVDADERTRTERAARDRGWDGSELTRREKLQKPLDSKRAQADYIVENNSDINTLRQRVERIYRQLIASF